MMHILFLNGKGRYYRIEIPTIEILSRSTEVNNTPLPHHPLSKRMKKIGMKPNVLQGPIPNPGRNLSPT